MMTESRLQSASWIGIPNDATIDGKPDHGTIQTVWFKTEFKADNASVFFLLMSANSRYKLWMNGERIANGPCKGDQGIVYYDEWNLTSHLKKGKNELLVMVVYYPMPVYGLGPMGGPLSVISHVPGPWLLASGVITDCSGGEREILTTGIHDWEVTSDAAYRWVYQNYLGYTATGPYEDIQGKNLPLHTSSVVCLNWVKPIKGFKAYYRCFGESSPLPLKERPIPHLSENRKDFVREIKQNIHAECSLSFLEAGQVVIPPLHKGVVLLDAGELTTGYLRLRVVGGTGSSISIRYAEGSSRKGIGQYDEKEIRDDFENYEFRGYQDIYRPGGEDELFEPFLFRTFRFVLIEVETNEEVLIVHRPYYHEICYPMEEVTVIQGENPWIKPLWDISVNTLKRCMHETYEDCPYYEQVQYVLDSRLEALYTYCLCGDSQLAKKTLEEFQRGRRPDGLINAREPSTAPNVIPSFALHWIMMLEEYYMQSGDLDFLKTMLPTVGGILNWFESRIDENGLIGGSEFWDFIDWVEGWQNEEGTATGTPNALKYGSSTILSLMLSATFKSAARLYLLFNLQDMAMVYTNLALSLDHAVRCLCWSQEAGLFREGPSFEEYTQHAQVWAVLSQAVSMDEGKGLMQKVMERKDLKPCSYASGYFLFRAMEATGFYAETERFWQPWIEAISKNLTTWPEDFTRQRSDCHGWSALPLYEFTACLLGVRPLKAGWKAIRVKPYYMMTTKLSGEVVTPVGKVKVTWAYGNTGVELLVDAPKGIPVEIILQDGTVIQLENGGLYKGNSCNL